MIHLVDAANRPIYADALGEMFRARKKHFIDERGWAALREENGEERDQFDDDKACYLLGFSATRALEVSNRLRPTADGSVIGDEFQQLAP